MGQSPIYNSIHNPQRSLDETIGFNHDDHLHRMCNETGIPEFLKFQIPGIPMVAMVTSRARSLHDPTQQDFINARTLPISTICAVQTPNLVTLWTSISRVVLILCNQSQRK